MRSLGVVNDDEFDSSNDSSDTEPIDAETQVFDSQFSPVSSVCGQFNAENSNGLRNTVPAEDTLPMKHAFETQVIDFDCETQVIPLDCETQVIPLDGETQDQPLDDETQNQPLDGDTQVMILDGETQVIPIDDETQMLEDLECGENIGTQLLEECIVEAVVESDGEGTEVLEDTEEFINEDSVRSLADHPLEKHKLASGFPCEDVGGENWSINSESNALVNEACNSGSTHDKFTSFRVASLRASGIEARRMISEKYNSISLLMNSSASEHSSKQWEKVDKEVTKGGLDEKTNDLINEKRCRIGSSAVRKLFTEDMDLDGPDDLTNKRIMADLPSCGAENDLSGLSYVDSQEPGDLSQANALEFVDRFLKCNASDFDEENDLAKSSRGKLKSLSSAKMIQCFAKKSNTCITVREKEIFDWDDSREDEGGGEFLQRMKETFLCEREHKRGGSSVPPRKSKYFATEVRAARKCMNKEDKQDYHDDTDGLVLSDSKFHCNQRSNSSTNETRFGKNLMEELKEQLDTGSNDGLAVTSVDPNVPDMSSIGVDTQMAAEAMEVLCFEVNLGGHEYGDTYQGTKDNQKSILKGERNDEVSAKQEFLQKKSYSSNSVFAKRQLKETISNPNLSTEPCGKEVMRKERKRGTSNAKQHQKGSVESSKLQSLTANKRKSGRKGSIKEDKTFVMQQHFEKKIDYYTPIACRTRQSLVAKESKRTASVSNDCRKAMTDLAGGDVSKMNGKRRPTAETFHPLNAKELTKSASNCSGKKRNIQQVRVPSKLTSSDVNIHVDHPRGQRTRRKLVSFVPSVDGKNSEKNKKSRIDDGKADPDITTLAEHTKDSVTIVAAPTNGHNPSTSACNTPVNCTTPVNGASPICMGDEYLKQSCRKNLCRSSLMKEINNLSSVSPVSLSSIKSSRRRRDIANVRVLFSQHLDSDILKQQKKILQRLGASEASSVSDATHFVTDKFVRTRNMLEAIAFGKPVVTNMWLESCGQACCLIDEKNHILRDTKKEKEFGFNMSVSLERACQHPLLQGQRVLITPNTKPGKEILVSLVKAVHGLAVERIGRSALKDDKVPDDLLVVSCEEDYAVCIPFLEKGAAIYSSELLLNGIVIQKLEYERHRLFVDLVKKTRSTIWVKGNDSRYLRVREHK